MIRHRSLFYQLVVTGTAVIVILGILWIGCGAWFRQLRDTAANARVIADNVRFNVLQARRAEKDFLLRDCRTAEFFESDAETPGQQRTQSLTRHLSAVTAIERAVPQLTALLPDKVEEHTRLADATLSYQEAFMEMVDGYRELGYRDWGLVKDLRDAADQIETETEPLDNSQIRIALLELRRRETDYLLSGDDYRTEVQDALDGLAQLIEDAANRAEAKTSEALTRSIRQYREQFDAYTRLNEKIGLTEQDGLRTQMRTAAQTIERIAANIANESANQEDTVEFASNLAHFAILLSGCVIGAMVFYFLARSIVRPLGVLKTEAQRLGRGDLAARVTVSSDSEIGDLAAAMNQMADSLQSASAKEQELSKQREEARRALSRSETLYRSLVENIPLSLFQKDLNLRFMFGNKRFCDAIGRPAEEIAGKTDHDFFPDQLATKYQTDDRAVMDNEEPIDVVEENVTADGTSRFVEVMKSPIRDDAGSVIGVQGLFWDVTDRVVAERSLNEANQFLDSIINNIPVMLFVKSAVDLSYVRVNSTFEQLVGQKNEDLVGLTDFDIYPQDQAEQFTQHDRDVLKTGKMVDIPEEPIQTKDFGLRVLHTRKIPVMDQSGRPSFLLGVSEDITVQKEAERALHDAKEAAEAANQAKSDFLANMSHEIRTPMNAVIGMTELLLDSELDQTQHDYVRMAHDSGESLLILINDILDFSKIEAGKMDLEQVPFRLRDCLGDTMKSLALRAHRSNLELAFDVAPDVHDCLIGDPARLRQLIINLVGNAIKFTEEGEVVLQVTSDTEVSASEQTKRATFNFVVRDTGIGIPETELDRIFDAFEQADSSTTRRFGGTGLGLAISSRIVEMMDGQIHVNSTIGEGSEFCFSIPFNLSWEDTPEPVLPNAEEIVGMRVLVVDDNATNRRILKEMLSVHDMQPVLAADADEAMQLLTDANRKGEPFPLVLTDVHMPDTDGFTFTRQIRDNSDLQDVIVMVLTSGDRPGDRQRCAHLGIAAQLLKPVKQSELFDSIVRVLGTPAEDSQQMAALASTDAEHIRPLNLLLAEDVHANQVLAMRLLEKRNHRVTVANNGREAVEHVKSTRFDAVLMDVQMPEMDGFEATAQIRQLESKQQLSHQTVDHLPIIAMTAHAMKGDRERCLEAGMDGYVAKPIKPSELTRVLQECVGIPQAEEPGASVADPEPGPETEPATGSEPADHDVDWSFALKQVDGDPSLLQQVVEAVLAECPGRLNDLQTAIDSQDCTLLKRSAHTIAGLMRTFDASTVADAAGRLEAIAKDNDFSATDALYEDLKHGLSLVTTELERWLQEQR